MQGEHTVAARVPDPGNKKGDVVLHMPGFGVPRAPPALRRPLEANVLSRE